MRRLLSQLGQLPAALAADVSVILKLHDDEDTKSQMLLELSKGKSLDAAVRHARADCARDGRWNGITPPRLTKKEKRERQQAKLEGKEVKTLSPDFSYLDHDRNEDEMSAHERLAAVDPSDLIDFIRARTHEFDQQTEAVLNIAREGGKALGKSLGLTGRRGQQIIQKQVKNVDEARRFREGGRGQGTLFSFDGEVA